MSSAHRPATGLDRLRGATPPCRHNARTIAALTANPGCARRAVLDAAGVDKPRLAQQIGFPARFGQSRFALARGIGFEAMLKADGCALLLDVLGEALGVGTPAADYENLGADGPGADAPGADGPGADGPGADGPGADGPGAGRTGAGRTGAGRTGAGGTVTERHARTRTMLARLAGSGSALVDHPMLTLDVAGQRVFLEPDLIAFQVRGRLHVVEIKSFAIVDGRADSAKVSAAAVQAAVYVEALRRLLAELGLDPATVSHDVVLVCPENFALRPRAVVLDVRKQLATLRRQLTRLAAVDDLVAALPADLSFDPASPPAALAEAARAIGASYAPECLSACELAYFCRHEAAGSTAALGRAVREALGGVTTVDEVLRLAAGTREPAPEQTEAAALLRTAARLRAEALDEPVPGGP